MKNFYNRHIFFCNNQKQSGKKCCESANTKKLYRYAKDQCRHLKRLGKGKLGVSESQCLGRCEFGPIAVVYPDNIWYNYKNKEDIDTIINQHLLNAQVVQDLKLP